MRKATNIDKPTAAWRVMATMDDGDGTRLCAISRNYAARDAADAFAELARKRGGSGCIRAGGPRARAAQAAQHRQD